MQPIDSYVYKITNRITNQFYYGSRTNNVKKGRQPEDDIWKKYFTSSNRIKTLILEYGKDAFDVEIVFRNSKYDFCFHEEQRLIREHLGNDLCLNRAYFRSENSKILTTFNESQEDRDRRIKKMSIAKRGKFNSNGHLGLKHSEETRERMKLAQAKLAYTHSEETKQKMRQYERTEEHSKNQSLSKRGIPWSDARRLAHINRSKS